MSKASANITVNIEKVTINMGPVDLGKVDLLVDDGFYGNRTDFIRTAIRNQLDRHEADTSASISRQAAGLGVIGYNASDLEASVAKGERLNIKVVGMLVLSQDITPELADQAIESVFVRGVLRAGSQVKDVLADRTH
jgi:Arc/MetJ-type ribon-helix-helix transcriptional regulator